MMVLIDLRFHRFALKSKSHKHKGTARNSTLTAPPKAFLSFESVLEKTRQGTIDYFRISKCDMMVLLNLKFHHFFDFLILAKEKKLLLLSDWFANPLLLKEALCLSCS